MFRKPFSAKPSSVLRSSDRRKTQQAFVASFPRLATETTEEESSTKTHYFPASLESAKIQTFNDDALVLYADATTKEPQCFFSPLHKEWFPSLYWLGRFPQALAKVYTHPPVVEKLANGADLMLPGTIPSLLAEEDRFQPGDLVAIIQVQHQGNGYTEALVGIGVLDVDEAALRRADKGKGVRVIHLVGDELWKKGSKTMPSPEIPPQEQEEDVDMAASCDTLQSLTLDQEEMDTAAQPEGDKWATETVDETFLQSVYHAIKYKVQPDVMAKHISLPMTLSLFFSNYVLPSRPVGTEAHVQIKASSWKKVAKLCKELEKQKIVKAKEAKGDVHITSFAFDHPAILQAPSYRTVAQGPPNAAAPKQAHVASPGPSSKARPAIKVTTLYKASAAKMMGLCTAAGWDRSDLYMDSEVRKMVLRYIEAAELTDPQDKRYVKLDAYLYDACIPKKDVQRLTRPELVKKLLEAMTVYHAIQLGNEKPMVKLGPVKPIHILVETRGGNKVVTRVLGLEHFQIDPEAFADDLKPLCASSVAVFPATGEFKGMEVLAQGSHLRHVLDILQQQGLDERFVMLKDKTGKALSKAKAKR